MKFGLYIKDKLGIIVGYAGFVIFTYLLMMAFHSQLQMRIMFVIVAVIFVVSVIAFDYLRKYKFYNSLVGHLDELDQKIIQLLIENARISYSDIGKETGISRVAVKARIQALEKQGIIEEYTTIINPQKISGAVSCYFEIETKPDHLSQVTDILHNNDTVTQIYRVTGRDKLHVHAVASSSDEMEHFLHTVIDTLPGVISCSCNTILSRIKDIKGLRL